MQQDRPGHQTADADEDSLAADSEGDIGFSTPPWLNRFDAVLVGMAFLLLVAMIVVAATE